MLIKKRQVLTATLIIALCAALAVNWYFTAPDSENNNTGITNSDEAVTGNLGDTLMVAGTTEKGDDANEKSSQDSVTGENSQNADKYFSEAKLKRTQAFDETVENIRKIINEDKLESGEKNKISVMLSDYQNDMKVQTDAENLISAKTGKACLVIINGDSCQVILEKNTLNDTLILQITEIIEKNTDIFSENLTIIELK